MSSASFYKWRDKFGGMDTSVLRFPVVVRRIGHVVFPTHLLDQTTALDLLQDLDVLYRDFFMSFSAYPIVGRRTLITHAPILGDVYI